MLIGQKCEKIEIKLRVEGVSLEFLVNLGGKYGNGRGRGLLRVSRLLLVRVSLNY